MTDIRTPCLQVISVGLGYVVTKIQFQVILDDVAVKMLYKDVTIFYF